MANTSQIRQLQTPDHNIDVYPLTLEDAVFDRNGIQLPTKLNAINASILTITGKVDNIENDFVSGVKGNAESTYRHGNVNLTLANLGYESVNDLNRTTSGGLLDARQGKAINTSILSVSGRVEDIETNISYTEDTTTSTREYEKGDFLTLGGVFYKVTRHISINDTLTVGTNIEETKIADELGGDGGGGSSLDYREFDLTQSSLSASVTYPQYPYEYSFSWTGATSKSFLQAVLTESGDEYIKPYALSGASDTVTMYFSESLNGTLHCVVYLSSTAELSDSSLLQNYVTKYAATDTTNVNSLQSQINAQGQDIDTLETHLTGSYGGADIPFVFGVDANGNYGYKKAGADTVTPFKTVVNLGTGSSFNVSNIPGYQNFTVDNFHVVCTGYHGSKNEGYASPPAFGGNTVNDSYTYNIEAKDTSQAINKAPTKSYSQSTGVLTVGNTSGSATYSTSATMRSGGSVFKNGSASSSIYASIDFYVLLTY